MDKSVFFFKFVVASLVLLLKYFVIPVLVLTCKMYGVVCMATRFIAVWNTCCVVNYRRESKYCVSVCISNVSMATRPFLDRYACPSIWLWYIYLIALLYFNVYTNSFSLVYVSFFSAAVVVVVLCLLK